MSYVPSAIIQQLLQRTTGHALPERPAGLSFTVEDWVVASQLLRRLSHDELWHPFSDMLDHAARYCGIQAVETYKL